MNIALQFIIIAAVPTLVAIFWIKTIVRKWKRDKEEYEYFKRENDKYRNK